MFIKKFNKTKCVNGCELFNDNSNYLYWENRNVTNDEIEITDFLNNKYNSQNISILHIGIGNSYVATKLKKFRNIDGISISMNEIILAKSLKIKNYKSYFFNKLENNVFSNKIFSKYDVIIDVNIKSFCCCEYSFKKLFSDYNMMLNRNGIIVTGKRGMNWSRIIKPVIRFSLKKFFFKRLKEFDGPKSNILSIFECNELAKEHSLKLNNIDRTNIVTFSKT
jgi:hypothetical protein